MVDCKDGDTGEVLVARTKFLRLKSAKAVRELLDKQDSPRQDSSMSGKSKANAEAFAEPPTQMSIFEFPPCCYSQVFAKQASPLLAE